jgi:hypothetical protein
MSKSFWIAAVILCTASPLRAALFTNGGFEEPDRPDAAFFPVLVSQASVPGWSTTSSAGVIEIWRNGFVDFSGNTFLAFEGDQFVELNALSADTLFQDVGGISAGSLVGFEFAHQGRFGVDTMQFRLTDLGADNGPGGGDDTILFQQSYTANNTGWQFHVNPDPITALGNDVRIELVSISAAGGNTQGNFVDAVAFGVDAGNVVPEPSSFILLLIGSTLSGGLAMARRRRPTTTL